jgi:hypothetical protein
VSSGQLNSMMMTMKMNRHKTKTPVFAQTAQSTFQHQMRQGNSSVEQLTQRSGLARGKPGEAQKHKRKTS